jgi:hypothetical protein
MSLIVTSNTVCDIIGPLLEVRASGLAIHLRADYRRSIEHGEADSPVWRYTHVAIVPLSQDVRDGYIAGAQSGFWDTVWVPNRFTGTPFQVFFVERRGRGSGADHKRVYLVRLDPPWPTSYREIRMAIPSPRNTTCDVYRSGNSPPAAPDVAGLGVHLLGDFDQRVERGEGYSTAYRYTHILLADLDADIRDGQGAGLPPFADADVVYVPDQDGTPFLVIFVERRGYGDATDHRRVYLDRLEPPWPTDEL